jgi:transposase
MERERRLVGIDLGISSAHTVRVLAGDGTEVCRRRCVPTVESLEIIEHAALAGAAEGTRLEVVMEPTGPAWLPAAVFFSRRQHTVYRVSSAKAADLRRFLSRHTKSNGIDADTLARLPLVDPRGLIPLELPDSDRAELARRVRATDRLTRQASEHKTRIRDLVRQLLPISPLGAALGKGDLAVLTRTGGHPGRLVEMGSGPLTELVLEASVGHLGAERAQQWLDAARGALALYGDHPAFAADALADEVQTEIRLLAAIEEELSAHATVREAAYRKVDPGALARSLPGVAEVGGPALVALMGRPGRFRTAAHFRSFTGLTPKTSETGDTERKGQAMSKAGPGLLRTTLVRSADIARMQDPQLARLYYVQMVERGASHIKACCVVGAHLAERALAVMQRGEPYVVRDTEGRPVDRAAAKALILERWTVPEEVRRRRRSRKARKAPQKVLMGHVETRRPSSPDMVAPAPVDINLALSAQRR